MSAARLLERLRQRHGETFVHVEFSGAAIGGPWLVGVRRRVLRPSFASDDLRARDTFVELARGRRLRATIRKALGADLAQRVEDYERHYAAGRT